MVSRRWWRLLQAPSVAWGTFVVDLDAELPADAQPNAGAVTVWFQRRAGAVHSLTLNGDATKPRIPAALVGAIIASQCSGLRSLEISVPACGVSGSDLGVLAACTQLTALRVYPKRGSCWTDHSVGILRNIQHLPALQRLTLQPRGGTPAAALPCTGHFTALQSPTLAKLVSAVVKASGGSLQLTQLPALRELELRMSKNLPDFIKTSTFTAVSGLTRLHLEGPCEIDCSLVLPLDSLRPLRLEFLSLVSCGLAKLPLALAAVGETLRELNLRQNRHFQLTAAAYGMLLAMPEVRTLVLKKGWGTESWTREMWTASSVQRIASLGRAHGELYPLLPPLEIQLVFGWPAKTLVLAACNGSALCAESPS